MIKSVHFGYRIACLNKKQENELKRMHRASILKKFELSLTFPRAVLCARKSALGIDLIEQ